LGRQSAPWAGDFLLRGQKKATKEKAARSRRSAARSSLRFSPGPAAMLGAAYGTQGATSNFAAISKCAISSVSEKSFQAIFCATRDREISNQRE